MAGYFFDSSALAKLYHPELGSVEVQRIFVEPSRRMIISKLTVVEVHSVFAGKFRSGFLTGEDVALLRDLFLVHLAGGAFEVFTLAEAHYDVAEQLVWQYGFKHRLRTLDALQLAVAADLRRQGLVDRFVAADK